MAAECPEVQELIPWVVNHSASPEEQRSLHQHIAACAGCRRELVAAIALARRVTQAIATLSPAGCSWSDLSTHLAEDDPQPAARPAESVLRLLETAGLPALAADAVRWALTLADPRPALRLHLPLAVVIDARG